ncbi:uncharacterized protein LOC119108205 [Pollicipes pollicipes]|uniref:uncharacterized protein LOC119108205 n=1 Tax=Pollicipes pollicipes TaxID=41117 RepID=UPI001884D9C5|nr:uncharacterized protein LOC119108205 [Pollicipes pollicipes]
MSDPDRTIWCGNVSGEVTDEVLYELFLQAGPLERVRRPRDQRTGDPRPFAFVTYEDEESVPYALELYRDTKLFGRVLRLQAQGGQQHDKQQLASNGRPVRRLIESGGGARAERADHRHSDRTAGRFSERGSERHSVRRPDRHTDRGTERASDRGAVWSNDRGTDKYNDHGAQRYDDHGADRYNDRGVERYGGRFAERYNERAGDWHDDGAPELSSGRGAGRYCEPTDDWPGDRRSVRRGERGEEGYSGRDTGRRGAWGDDGCGERGAERYGGRQQPQGDLEKAFYNSRSHAGGGSSPWQQGHVPPDRRLEPKTPQIEYRTALIASGKNLTVRVGEEVDVQCRARYGNPPPSSMEPKTPQIEYRTALIASGKNLTVRVGEEVDVQCRARYGNPPAIIKWFIGETDLTHLSTQQNQTELDNTKTSAALSVLRHTFGRQMAGAYLRCVAVHEAYDTKSRDTIAKLDVQYPPEVKLLGRPERDVEESVDTVVLRCKVDANPPANVFWRFISKETGRTDTFYVDTLELRPVTKKNSGTYECEAGNSVGKSDPLSTTLDVKYAPSIYRVQPQHHVTVGLYNTTELACEAEGSPPPSYQWLQRLPDADGTVFIRGTSQLLRIHNITYANQGQYVCVAKNVINGNERRVQGDTVEVEVIGPPQVLRRQQPAKVMAEQGGEAVLEVALCSDPLPTLANWHWGSLQLQAGQSKGRFVAEEITQDTTEDCYRARLRVLQVTAADERDYYLKVQNDRGSDQYGLALRVKEPVTMTAVISLVCGCLVLLVLVVALLLYAFKKEKWCFSQKGGFKPTDLESEKSEVESRTEGAARQGLGAIPPDALYSGPKKPGGHGQHGGHGLREAAKHRGEDGDSGKSDSSRGGIIYADLQLPKTSNNGSMRKYRNERHLLPSEQRHLAGASRNEPARTEYAEIKFVPKIDERADI